MHTISGTSCDDFAPPPTAEDGAAIPGTGALSRLDTRASTSRDGAAAAHVQMIQLYNIEL